MNDIHKFRQIVIENNLVEYTPDPQSRREKCRSLIDRNLKQMISSILLYQQISEAEVEAGSEEIFDDTDYVIDDIISQLEEVR